MVVYLDVLWALNFFADSLLLYLTAIYLKRRIRIWKLAAGGFVGSLIILLAFTPINDYTNHPLAKLLCSIIMVWIVFGYKRFTYFLKALMTFYVATFLIGGALIGAHFFIQYDELTIAALKGFGDPISWLFVLIGFPIAWQFSRKNIEGMEMTKIQFDQLVKVRICIEETTMAFKGLVDSGNQLYDPLSRQPVMFVSLKNYSETVSDSIQQLMADPELLITGSEALPDEWQHRIRIIPTKVVGHEHQLIVAIKPDVILIEKNGDEFICEKGLVSFTMQQLSADDAFQCIVHPKMLTGPKRHGGSVKVS